jgi:shikimate kinase
MKNIILIGMPGAGKSTVGVIIAKVLGYNFVDTDLIIQEKKSRLLHEIILQDGLDNFVAIENQIIRDLEIKRSVIATGGSAIYGKEAMEHLGKIGTIVYLQLSYKTIKERLGNIQQRGVVLKTGQNLKELYLERCPYYEKYAHIIIDAEGLEVEEVINKVRNCFTNNENVL